MAMDKGKAFGYLMAVIQAVAYSTMGIFGKLLYAVGLDSSEVLVVRFTCTTALLGTFLLFRRKERVVSKDPAIYVQSLFFFLSAWFYFLTVEHLSAGLTTVIFYLFPAFVAIINLFAFKEKLALTTGVALLLAIGGTAVVSGFFIPGEATLDGQGIAFGLLACLTFAIYTVLIQRTGRSESSLTTTFTITWANLIASLLVFAPAVPSVIEHSTAYVWGIGCAIALLNTILPILLYIVAIKRIGGTEAALISIAETPFSLLFAYLILGEILTVWQGIGTVLIVIGIVLVTAEPLLKRNSGS